jgi:hypothetical protein
MERQAAQECKCEGHKTEEEALTIFQHLLPGENVVPLASLPRFAYHLEVYPPLQPVPALTTKLLVEDEVYLFDGFYLLAHHPVSVPACKFTQSGAEYHVKFSLPAEGKSSMAELLLGKQRPHLTSISAEDVQRLEWIHSFFWEHGLHYCDWLRPSFSDGGVHEHGMRRFLFYPKFVKEENGTSQSVLPPHPSPAAPASLTLLGRPVGRLLPLQPLVDHLKAPRSVLREIRKIRQSAKTPSEAQEKIKKTFEGQVVWVGLSGKHNLFR